MLDYPVERIESTGLRWMTTQFLFIGEVFVDVAIQVAKSYPQLFKSRSLEQQPSSGEITQIRRCIRTTQKTEEFYL